ncbi:hypothetical protein DY000_02047769 [Brassica cretica]|uniref:Uncharacterized protein n=1 Tax=Brassica cretica TaxID=69181 RepID=A0ABQ7F129_BRACR|nr:hypothetical protein DY000_02047769 [Brassica cretica]
MIVVGQVAVSGEHQWVHKTGQALKIWARGPTRIPAAIVRVGIGPASRSGTPRKDPTENGTTAGRDKWVAGEPNCHL